ncbi:glutathione peroxidase [Flavobacterium dauae]|uniref:glutathione peroxidase n=1 Tax=Flavobacterium dauae TaxID=1563479 RepID=UPI00101B2EB6
MKTTTMKTILLSISSLFMFACFGGKKVYTVDETTKNKITDMENNKTIYDFKVETITGETFDLSSLKGKKVLIVNTASKCGLTPQFEQLEALYQKYKDQNFVIIGFPTNDFMSQDPGSNEEIAEFCKLNYGVTFPMMAKIVVKGKEKHPLYQYLTEKSQNQIDDFDIEWNFQKFLINENGTIDKVISPRVLPDAKEIVDWIEEK